MSTNTSKEKKDLRCFDPAHHIAECKCFDSQENTWEKDFIEKGAVLEHARWASWQNYLHTFLVWNNDIQMWTLPHDKKEHWDEQIRTPYSMLTEHEKEMDRKEVRTYLPLIEKLLSTREKEITEDTSDGYHTFKELYEFRKLYNAALFNEWAKHGLYKVHKSQRHNDSELCFGRDDYFIVVATLPTGQISNHYPMSDWDLFQCEAREKSSEKWDGHTSQDVADRLTKFLSPNTTL